MPDGARQDITAARGEDLRSLERDAGEDASERIGCELMTFEERTNATSLCIAGPAALGDSAQARLSTMPDLERTDDDNLRGDQRKKPGREVQSQCIRSLTQLVELSEEQKQSSRAGERDATRVVQGAGG